MNNHCRMKGCNRSCSAFAEQNDSTPAYRRDPSLDQPSESLRDQIYMEDDDNHTCVWHVGWANSPKPNASEDDNERHRHMQHQEIEKEQKEQEEQDNNISNNGQMDDDCDIINHFKCGSD